MKTYRKEDLAIYGGSKTRTSPTNSMWPGAHEIGEEEKKEVIEVLDNQYLWRYFGSKPSKVKLLEEECKKYLGVHYCLAVNSGTSALITALVSLRIGAGDEVIVPAYTFFATVAAVVAVRATPIIAEIDKTLNIDPNDVEKKITPRTKAIIPVHMRGTPAKVNQILAIAKKYSLKVVEDVAQAMGGAFQGRHLGTFGNTGCFSLQQLKIITCGEGGLLVTNDLTTYKRAQAYHDTSGAWINKFQPDYDDAISFGQNYRMSELNGAVALAQHRKLDSILARMRHNKKLIKQQLQNIGLEFREIVDDAGDTGICLIWFLPKAYLVQDYIQALKAEGVETYGIYYMGNFDWNVYSLAGWKMLTRKMMLSENGAPSNCAVTGSVPDYRPAACPQTLMLLRRAVHLDIPPQLTEQDCEQIAEAICKVTSVFLH